MFQGSFGALATAFESRWDRASNDTDAQKMTLLPLAGEGVLGYCHGMNWAIMQAKMEGSGTPYEVAVGTKTTKLASCFGCTTFMYATDFPPSNIHFGRAEPWVPLPESKEDLFAVGGVTDKEWTAVSGAATELNAEWASAVGDFLMIGTDCLIKAASLGDGYQANAQKLMALIQSMKDKRSIANLFLDALTVHESEVVRLGRVLGLPKG